MPEDKHPEAPELLPAKQAQDWKKRYNEAYKASKSETPEGAHEHHRGQAVREANKMLRVPMPESHDEADALEPWQLLEEGGKVVTNHPKTGKPQLTVRTIDGKKATFDVPPKKEKQTPAA